MKQNKLKQTQKEVVSMIVGNQKLPGCPSDKTEIMQRMGKGELQTHSFPVHKAQFVKTWEHIQHQRFKQNNINHVAIIHDRMGGGPIFCLSTNNTDPN